MNETVKVYTKKYTPFRFGGVWTPIYTRAVPLETYNVGDFQLLLFKNPGAEYYHVAEGSTGALVGSGKSGPLALAMVIQDLATADPAVVESQMETARVESAQAEWEEPDRFWAMISG